MAAAPALIAISAISAAGAIYGGVASYQQASYQADIAKQTSEYQARVADANAEFQRKMGEYNAQTIMANTRAEVERTRRAQARDFARVRGLFGTSGATMAGSPIENLADYAMENEEVIQLIRFAGQQDARGARFGAAIGARSELLSSIDARFRGETLSNLYTMGGQASLVGAGFQAGTSLLGGYYSAYGAGGANNAPWRVA